MKGNKRKQTEKELEDEIHRIEEHDINSDETNSDGEKYEETVNDTARSIHFSDEYVGS